MVVEEDDKVEEELWGLHSHTYERACVPCEELGTRTFNVSTPPSYAHFLFGLCDPNPNP